ncbi:ATP-binding protein [Thermodesulfobacteriota bacterium]
MKIHPIKATLQKLKPFIGKKADAFWVRYMTSDRFERQEWEQTINLLAQKYNVDSVDDEVVLPPPSAELSEGDINIGQINYLDHQAHDFDISLPEITRHMGIFGSTGSGKTTLAKNIIRKLVKKNIPFIVFDWEKNYRDLVSEFKEIKIFTIGDNISPFYFNYLNLPPGLSYQEYIKNVIAVFNRAYIGGVGSDSVLLKVFDQAYMENRIPTTKDVQKILKKEMKGRLRGRDMLWKQSSMRMFDFLCYGGTGELLKYQKPYPTEKLFDYFVIFELGNLASPNDKRFFIEMFTLWYWLFKEHTGIENETLKHVLIFEEFHNIVLNSQKEDFIQKIFRQIRKYGTGLIIIDQTPSLIPNPIFENLYTKISFSLSHNKNVQAVSSAMFMDFQEQHFFGMLKTGQAICRLMGRYSKPFLIDIPFVKTGSNVSDEEIKQHMAVFSEFSKPKTAPFEKISGLQSFQKPETLSPLAKILIGDIAQNPFIGVSHRYKKLGLGVAEGNNIQIELIEKGIVIPKTIEGKKFLEITDSGKKLMNKFGINLYSVAGRGGIEHSYYVDKIKNQMVDAGGFAFIEKDDIDVVGFKLKPEGEYFIAVQVETGKSNIKNNIQKLIDYKADEKHIVATSKQSEITINKILSNFEPHQKNTIHVSYAKNFLKNFKL